MTTIKQRRFIKKVFEGKSPTQAAVEVYDVTSRENAAKIASANLKKQSIQALMGKMGIDNGFLLKELKEQVKARRGIYGGDGKLIASNPDNQARLKAIEMAFKLQGILGNEGLREVLPPNINLNFLKVTRSGKRIREEVV